MQSSQPNKEPDESNTTSFPLENNDVAAVINRYFDSPNGHQQMPHEPEAASSSSARPELIIYASSAKDPERYQKNVNAPTGVNPFAARGTSANNNPLSGGSFEPMANRRSTSSRQQQRQQQSVSKRGGASSNGWSEWSQNLTSLTGSGGPSRKMELLQQSLPEDLRISKLLRRLATEKNPTAASDLCEKLTTAISDPTNTPYIRRSFDLLAESIIGLLQDEAPHECRPALVAIFGRLGFVLRNNLVAYLVWIVKCYKIESLRVPTVQALLKTLQLDAANGNRELREHAVDLMEMLKGWLEDAEQAPLFVAITETIRQFCRSYVGAFEPHFRDIVDIVVGWHLETDQTVELKQHCGRTLQGFDRCWARDGTFIENLLRQFLEDIVGCGEEIVEAERDGLTEGESPRRLSPILDGTTAPEDCFAALVGAFNSVLKSIPHKHIGWPLLTESFVKITGVAEPAIAHSHDAELLINLNEFIIIVLNLHPFQLQLPFDFLRRQLSQLSEYSERQVLSTLMLILKVCDEKQVDHIVEFVDELFRCDSPIRKLRFTASRKVRTALAKIYEQVLNIKNVIILQSVYNHVLTDLGIALNCLGIITAEQWPVPVESSTIEYSRIQAELTVTFYITALAQLATSTASIIALWALQPSILMLLTQQMQSHSFDAWKQHPGVHLAIVSLLVAHCRKNNNFVASSALLNAESTRICEGFNMMSFDSPTSSPTSKHFEIILDFTERFLQNLVLSTSAPNEQTSVAYLDWTNTLFSQITAYANILQDVPTFNRIALSLCDLTSTTKSEVLRARSATCLETLQQFTALNRHVQVALAETCLVLMWSTDESVRDRFAALFLHLPLAVILPMVSEPTGLAKTQRDTANGMLHRLSTHQGESTMRSKTFMRMLKSMQLHRDGGGSTAIGGFRMEAMDVVWSALGKGNHHNSSDMEEIVHFVRTNRRGFLFWAQFSAAQLCVDNRLRTPLGKPNDTISGLERLLTAFAGALSQTGDSTSMMAPSLLLANQQGMRFQLEFLESLEKVIHNAAEGTAFAMPQPERPRRMFFGVNASTCKEYFNRNRLTVNVLGMHGMDAPIVVRNSEIVLRDLVNSNKSLNKEFDVAIVQLTYALIQNGESDTLHGLAEWCKKTAHRNCPWVGSAADQAAGRYEEARNGYLKFITESDPTTLSQRTREFIEDQIVMCFNETHDWSEMKDFLCSLEETNAQRITLPQLTKSSSQLEAIINHLDQSSDNSKWIELCDWNVLSANAQSSSMLSYHKLLSVVENTLLESLVDRSALDQAKLQLCKTITAKCLQECLRTQSQEHVQDIIILGHMCDKIEQNSTETDLIASLRVDQSVGPTALSRVISWCDMIAPGSFNRQQRSTGDRNAMNQMHLDLCSVARKHGNYSVCRTMLDKYCQDALKMPWSMITSQFVADTNAAIGRLNSATTRALYEGVKLLHHEEQMEAACKFAVTLVMGVAMHDFDPTLREESLRRVSAKTLLTLSKWVQSTPEMITDGLNADLQLLSDTMANDPPYSFDYSLLPAADSTVGKLILLSINQCPDLAKAWAALGNWCFQLARNDGPTAYYATAAESYFKFLQLSSGDSDTENSASSKVSVTLRILQLVVKPELNLQAALDEGLTKTPTSPWTTIIPQLFARINHPVATVRRLLTQLVCRIAVNSPHLIIFPAVVGSLQDNRMDLTTISQMSVGDGEVMAGGEHAAPVDSALTCCFNAMLEIIAGSAPEMVVQVKCLVRELQRITLLWDELWLIGLTQIFAECSRRFARLDHDYHHSTASTTTPSTTNSLTDNSNNNTNISERYRITLRPLIFIMERLQKMTSVRPETQNERSFQRDFTKPIEDTLVALRKPFDSRFRDNWHKFTAFYNLLQTKSLARPLRMKDISPVLAQMRDTSIRMPGVAGSEEPILVKCVNNDVRILPSKTKPKKLSFHGSDGQRYTYLFKGLEDLHLDERVMQFLSVANSIMRKSSGIGGPKYCARHYSVIPLGLRSGLISWVEGVTPVFGIYRRWLGRENFQPKKTDVKSTTTGQRDVDKGEVMSVRMSELYKSKLVPRLAEHKVKITDNRKDWPLEATRKVFDELVAETPRDLLSKELWCKSISSADWRKSVRNFGHSVAVMSVIGYVIGLGDRHLSNILIDLETGEVVHIDYNMCFEKAKTLRVPERVPFRMTQNIEDALGVTGVEGTFRLTCEKVLATLRDGSETLLTLLEAFVYDPLVEWAIGEEKSGALAVAAYGGEALGDELRQAHLQMEHEVLRDTLNLRFAEMRADWMRNSNDFRELFHQMQILLQEMLAHALEKSAIEARRNLLQEQSLLLDSVPRFGSAMLNHSLNTASRRYEVRKRTTLEHERIRDLLSGQQAQSRDQMKRYVDCVREATQPNACEELLRANQQVNNAINMSEFEIVRELLENSTQGAMYVEGDKLRQELNASYLQQATILGKCIEDIVQYSEVAMLYPNSETIQKHRITQYANWCEMLINDPTSVACHQVIAMFQQIFGHTAPRSAIPQEVNFAFQLYAAWTTANEKLQQLNERVQFQIQKIASISAHNQTNELTTYLRNGDMDCVSIEVLCDINKEMLQLEKTASFDIHQKTEDIEIVFGKLSALTNIAIHTCETYTNSSHDPILRGLRTARECHHNLRNIHQRFVTAILTQIISGIASEEPSIMAMITLVLQLEADPIPISEQLKQLRLHTINGEMSAHHFVDKQLLLNVAQLQHSIQDDPKSPGSLLFTELWASFESLDVGESQLMEIVETPEVLDEWRSGIDQVEEATKLSKTNPLARNSRNVTHDFLLLSRWDTIIQTFKMCLHQMQLLRSVASTDANTTIDFNVDLPVRQFIVNYGQHILGVATTSLALFIANRLQNAGSLASTSLLEELCRTFVDTSLANGSLTQSRLENARIIYSNVVSNWRCTQSIDELNQEIQCQREICLRSQRLLAVHMWYNEEMFAAQPGLIVMSPINRSAMMMQMTNAIEKLASWRMAIAKMRSETASLETAITQRLNWAVGANPQLAEVYNKFTAAVNLKKIHYDQADHLSDVIVANCSAILTFERLRFGTADTLESDQKFFDLVSAWEKTCNLKASCIGVVTPVEEALVELLDPEGPLDLAWLSSVVAIVAELCDLEHDNLVANKRAIGLTSEKLTKFSEQLRVQMSVHQRLAGHVKGMLRKIFKVETDGAQLAKEFLRQHAEFVELVSDLYGHTLRMNIAEDGVVEVNRRVEQIDKILGMLPLVFDGLFSLQPPEKLVLDIQQQDPVNNPKKNSSTTTSPQKCNASSPKEIGNKHAICLLNRIRMKLDGHESLTTPRFTVAEHVNWMIEEARHPDNLAVLYEGWAPWV